MPLDLSWPRQRLRQACNAARPAAILWSRSGAGGLGCPDVEGFSLVELPALGTMLQPDGSDPTSGAAGAQAAPLAEELLHQRCCYVLFTSGSTGAPLGVLGTEAGLLNRCRWMQAVHPFQVRRAPPACAPRRAAAHPLPSPPCAGRGQGGVQDVAVLCGQRVGGVWAAAGRRRPRGRAAAGGPQP